MSKSARRALLDCPAARAAAKTLPYIRAESASKGNGSQVAVAHCKRAWRRARSSLFSVACGPAASSASVTAVIADSSGSWSVMIWSSSIRTDVSRTPRLASVIRARINYGIEICTELRGIDPGSFSRRIRDGRARHEATSLNGSQFSDRRAVSAHDDRSPSLHLTEYCGGLIAKLSLSDRTNFHESN